ncbi:EAL domain-containing protein [Ferrigenium sp. UT5]|uniref:EAL domain-containing protein n=1 Tax=Ferrigenium sp. UT5 TaxID=3242105 RepID=UPI00354AF6DB
MNDSLLLTLRRLRGWRLIVPVSLAVLLAVELIVSGMDLLLNGQVSAEYLLTGLVAAGLAAPASLYFVERLLAELARIEQQALKNDLTSAIDTAQMVFWQLDLSSGQLRYDGRAMAWLGADLIEAHSVDDWLKLVHPDDRGPFLQQFQAALPPGAPDFNLAYRIAQHTGGWGWVRTRGRITRRDAAGTPLLAEGGTLNINPQKQAEIEVQETSARLQQIFEANPDLMLISRLADGRITDVNEAFVRISGFSRAEAIGNTTLNLNLWTNGADRERMVHELTRRGRCENLETTFQTRAGQTVRGSLFAVVTRLNGAAHVISTMRDITQQKQLQDALRSSDQRLRLALEAAHMGVWEYDFATNRMHWSEEIFRYLGLEAGQASKEFFLQSIVAEDAEIPLRALQQALTGGHDYHAIYRVRINATVCWIEDRGQVKLDADGRPQKVVAVIHDITPYKTTEEELRRHQARLNNAQRIARIGHWELELGTNKMSWSDEVFNIFQWDAASPPETYEEFMAAIFPEDRAAVHDTFMRAMEAREPCRITHRARMPDGTIKYVEEQCETHFDPEGNPVRSMGTAQDITERKASEDLIWKQANFDQLTGLPNRRMFYDRLAQDIKKAHRGQTKLALMFLDLDHFKEVNDTLGHGQGDALLVEAAQRITTCVRESDTVARLGGDEFTLILSELEDRTIAERIAIAILTALARPFKLDGAVAYVSASIGITLFPEDAVSLDDMLKNADQAMYVAKNAGRNRFSYFTSAMQDAALFRLQIQHDLRTALSEQQFQVHYQPIVETRSGRIHKAEALLRWFHPQRGLINPAEFIPQAEESGLIHEIGAWVFAQAARQAREWASRYSLDFQISVNASPLQIQSKMNHSKWQPHLESNKTLGRNLLIEITEGVLLGNSATVRAELSAYREAGIQLAIDDFGTGYSALYYLKKLDVAYIKLDQSFIRNLEHNENDTALVEAIIMMAHRLGLQVIAEGVETQAQLDIMTAMGCDFTQGFLHSRAIPAHEFEQLLLNHYF